MPVDIVVVGSVNMDLIIRTPRMPAIGETIQGHDFHVIPGGKGANQATAAARQGGHVTFIGCIGDDEFGQQQKRGLSSEGIDLSYLSIIEQQKTGVALILVDDNHENSIVLSSGANQDCSTARVEAAAHVIAKADILICQLEVPLPSVLRAIEIAHTNKTTVLFNPAPALPLDDIFFEKVDYIIPNETEISHLTQLEVVDPSTAQHAVQQLLNKGTKHVLITLGDQGVVIAKNMSTIHQSAPSVEALDTTAAGDTFIGSLAVILGEGKSLAEAVSYAQHAAALAVTKFGAQSSIPHREEVEKFLKSSRKNKTK